jgi:3-keto-5-aminohexanoate cleavage enzyme
MPHESPFVLNFSPTGMMPRRDDSPHVPLDPHEIVDQVGEAAAAGVTVVHLHARDADGTPTHAPAMFARIIEGIRASHPDLVICVSLSGRLCNDFESRAAPLQLTGALKPDMASLTLSSMNFSRDASISTPEMVARLAREMLARGVAPELEVFDTGMVNYAKLLTARGLIQPPFYFNLILGNASSAQADPLSLGAMLAMLPQPGLWAAGGIGRAQTAAHALALAAGGGVRTGLEDNLFLDRARTTRATNLQLVRRVHELAGLLERPVMTPAEFRRRMNFGAGCGAYGRNPVEPSDAA